MWAQGMRALLAEGAETQTSNLYSNYQRQLEFDAPHVDSICHRAYLRIGVGGQFPATTALLTNNLGTWSLNGVVGSYDLH